MQKGAPPQTEEIEAELSNDEKAVIKGLPEAIVFHGSGPAGGFLLKKSATLLPCLWADQPTQTLLFGSILRRIL